MHDMARKLQRNKDAGASLAMGASKDSLYTIQDGGAPSHRIAASSGQVGAGGSGGLLLWAVRLFGRSLGAGLADGLGVQAPQIRLACIPAMQCLVACASSKNPPCRLLSVGMLQAYDRYGEQAYSRNVGQTAW